MLTGMLQQLICKNKQANKTDKKPKLRKNKVVSVEYFHEKQYLAISSP